MATAARLAGGRALPLGQVRRVYLRHEPALLGTLGLLLLLAAWEVGARVGWLNPVIASSPTRVAEALVRLWAAGQLPRDLSVTLLELGMGLLGASLVGVLLGLLMGLHRDAEAMLGPFVWFFYSAPLITFYPLLMLWLGLGLPTVVAIIVLLTTVPIAVNTLVGVRSADPLLLRAVRSFGACTLATLANVVLPSALPMVLAGLRIGAGRALIGVVLGEMFSANAGLGYRLTFYGARLRATEVLVQVVVLVLIGVALTQTIRLLERRLVGWRDT